VLPTIITQIVAGMNEISLGNLTTTRDFCFVRDTVAGFLAVMDSPRSVGEVINVGGDFEVSIGDAAKMIAELMRREISIRLDPQRLRPAASEVDRLWAATDKARTLTEWRPQFGGIDGFKRGLQETITWFSGRGERERQDASRYHV
jgi:dTDP-glucose 4,6-dehydratase